MLHFSNTQNFILLEKGPKWLDTEIVKHRNGIEAKTETPVPKRRDRNFPFPSGFFILTILLNAVKQGKKT